MPVSKLTAAAAMVLILFSAGSTMAAIALSTVTKANQKDSKLSFTADVQPAPSGSGAKQVTLVIPAQQAKALFVTPNTSYAFQIREGRDVTVHVPLALSEQPDGSLKTKIIVSEANAKKAWVVLHVWLSPEGSGTQFSIDLGSYLAD